MLEKSNIIDSKIVWTPLTSFFKIFVAEFSINVIKKKKILSTFYDKNVDNLMECTKFDIALSIVQLYENTKKYDLLFDDLLNNVKILLVYVDVDYVQDLDKSSTSTIEYVFKLDDGCIS